MKRLFLEREREGEGNDVIAIPPLPAQRKSRFPHHMEDFE